MLRLSDDGLRVDSTFDADEELLVQVNTGTDAAYLTRAEATRLYEHLGTVLGLGHLEAGDSGFFRVVFAGSPNGPAVYAEVDDAAT